MIQTAISAILDNMNVNRYLGDPVASYTVLFFVNIL